MSVAQPGALDAQVSGRKEGACVLLTGPSIPGLPRKKTEPAGILSLSFTGAVKATVPPRVDGDYLQTATPAWFHSGESATLAFSGSDAVEATGLDGVLAPSPLPAITADPEWSAGRGLSLSWPAPVASVGSVTAYVSAAGPGGGLLLECEAPLKAGRLEVPAAFRARVSSATSGGVLQVNVVSRSTGWSWRAGWLLIMIIEHAASTRSIAVGVH